MTDRTVFLARWIRWITLGESLGFLAPALAQLVAAAVWPAATFLLLVLAGFVEGAVLGWFQGRVLRNRLPAVSIRRWIRLTGAAAAMAWTLGLLPSASSVWQAWPATAQIAAGTIAAIVLLVSIGLGQRIELRHHVPCAPGVGLPVMPQHGPRG